MKYRFSAILIMLATLVTGCSRETDLQEFIRIKETCEKQGGILGKTKKTWVGRYGQSNEYDVYACTIDGKFVVKMK